MIGDHGGYDGFEDRRAGQGQDREEPPRGLAVCFRAGRGSAAPRDAEILFLRRENEFRRQKLDLVLRRFFGKSSEKLDLAQLELLLGSEPPGKEEAFPRARSPRPHPADRTSRRRSSRLPGSPPVRWIRRLRDLRKAAAVRHQHVELAACWAHARWKLHDALDSSPRLAGWLTRQTGHLYAVERRLRGQRAGPALRNAFRCSESRLAYERIGKAVMLLLRRRDVTPKSPLGMAIRYIHGLWPRLGVFLRDGRVEADTNLVENAIRPTAVGKRNRLFVGSAEGGWKAAVFHTLIGNCRRLGIDPYAYLKDVLERLPSASRRDLPGLLPTAWARYDLPKKAG